MTKNERCQRLPKIKNQEHHWEGFGRYSQMPYIVYSDDVNKWIMSFCKLGLIDYDYRENLKKIGDKPLSELSRDEILTKITSLICGERISCGKVATALENGTIETLIVRLHEITLRKK